MNSEDLMNNIRSAKAEVNNLIDLFATTDMTKEEFLFSYFRFNNALSDALIAFAAYTERQTLEIQRQYDETRH